MILEDDGVRHYVENVLEHSTDSKELKSLCKALYQRLHETEMELDMAIECIENSGVDWSEIRENMED